VAKAYSEDFRQKVMQAIELDGLKKSEASQVFNISRNIAFPDLMRYK
jgi:transposase